MTAPKPSDAADAPYCLNCPCCGEDVFVRAENIYGEDESEQCSDCGCWLQVAIDTDDTADATWVYDKECEASGG